VDLDRFTLINESLGREVGDRLLEEVGTRLRKCLRSCDTVTRMGRDDYLILLDRVRHLEALRVSDRIHRKLLEPTRIGDHDIFLSASIGIAYSSQTHTRAEELLREAEIAMCRARGRGMGQSEVFDVSMREQVKDRLRLEMDLRRAIQEREFLLHYQPIVSLATGQIAAFEALLRWNHPDRGMVYPGEFLPLAEETGLSVKITDWVLQEVCNQLAVWRRYFQGPPPLHVSVNLASQYLTRNDLTRTISGCLQKAGIEADHLALELTESQIVADAQSVSETLRELSQWGIRVYIDDFGTGYSSLSYLATLPIHALKIDRSFIHELDQDGKKAKIVQAIVSLAHNLGLQVVAEGVEREEELRPLRAMQCELIQGYLLARPMERDAVEQSLRKAQGNRQLGLRRYVRYYASGSLILDVGEEQYRGVPINLSLGGLLFTAERIPPVGASGILQLHIAGFSETIVTRAQIVRVYGSTAAATFPALSEALARGVAWLSRNQPSA
jgi:diguanylate cyclase (GGDEF)-like protein